MGRPGRSSTSSRRKVVYKPAWDDTTRDHRQEFRLTRADLVRRPPLPAPDPAWQVGFARDPIVVITAYCFCYTFR